MPECFNCGCNTQYVIDSLLPDKEHVAFACRKEDGGCGQIFRA